MVVTEGGIIPLTELLAKNQDYYGIHPKRIISNESILRGELPILVKLIDAKQTLSIQVHPNDEYAMKNENGSLGKTEMWYVLSANEGASIINGFIDDISKEDITAAIADNTLTRFLRKIFVKRNDVFMITPGTVHAIGAGIVIAEIQENSNITYRLYDYGRVDNHGKLRDLHIEKAMDVALLSKSEEPKQPIRVLKYSRGCAKEKLGNCKYFYVERMLINATEQDIAPSIIVDETSFQVLLCYYGSGTVISGRNTISFRKGDCIFVPASCGEIVFVGEAGLLIIKC